MRRRDLLPLLIAAGAGGCRRSDWHEGKTRLRVWSMWTGDEARIFRAVLDAYERENPRLEFENISTNAADDKTIRAIIAGAPPDLCTVAAPEMLGQFAATGAALCLDDRVRQSALRLAEFTSGAINQCRYRGKLYAMPFLVDCIALLWNKRAYEEVGLDPERPPRSLDELQDFAVRLTRREGNGNLKRLGCLIPAEGYGMLIATFAGRLYDAERDAITADDPRNFEALQWWKRFNDAQGGYHQVKAFEAGFGQAQGPDNPFFVGKAAMIRSGQWYPYWATKYAPTLRMGAAAFPGRHAPTPAASGASVAEPFAWLGGNFFLIPSGSAHVQEAWDFTVWMQTDAAQFLFADTMHGVPNTFGALRDQRLRTPRGSSDAWRRVFGNFMDLAGSRNATHFPVLPMMSFYDSVMKTAVESIGFGTKTVEQALRDAQERVSREYAKWR